MTNLLFITPTLQTRGARVSLLELIGGIKKTRPDVDCFIATVGYSADVDWKMWSRYVDRSRIIVLPTASHMQTAMRNLPTKEASAVIWHEHPAFPTGILSKRCPWVFMPRTPFHFHPPMSASDEPFDITIYPSRYCMGTYGATESDTVKIVPTGIDTEYYASFARPWSERLTMPRSYKYAETRSDTINQEQFLKRLSQTSLLLSVDPYECFGRMPVEAACMGVPTLAVPEGALPELRERDLPITFWGESDIDWFNTQSNKQRLDMTEYLVEQATTHFDHVDYANRFLDTISPQLKGLPSD